MKAVVTKNVCLLRNDSLKRTELYKINDLELV